MNDFIWHKHKHFCQVLLSNVANNMVDRVTWQIGVFSFAFLMTVRAQLICSHGTCDPCWVKSIQAII
jgi:hypothetical protein